MRSAITSGAPSANSIRRVAGKLEGRTFEQLKRVVRAAICQCRPHPMPESKVVEDASRRDFRELGLGPIPIFLSFSDSAAQVMEIVQAVLGVVDAEGLVQELGRHRVFSPLKVFKSALDGSCRERDRNH